MYERGIHLLTLGKIKQIHRFIVDQYPIENKKILDVGCGTGALDIRMAKNGGQVIAIDSSLAMLGFAKKRLQQAGCYQQVTLKHMDATQIQQQFNNQKFDLIIMSLMLSELEPEARRIILKSCIQLLKPEGKMLLVDEIVPEKQLNKLIFYLFHAPLKLLTFLLTRTTTHPIKDIQNLFNSLNASLNPHLSYLGGSLRLYEIQALTIKDDGTALDTPIYQQLSYQVNLRTILQEIWAFVCRIIPPYPKQATGLYAVGKPTSHSPVLVTGNFYLTVRRVLRQIDKKVDAWLLVCDSAGINVWCAAGGGHFTAEKIISAINVTRLDKQVQHRQLILPQLCANGVDGWLLRRQCGWQVHWGPVKAEDLPAYLAAGCRKTDAMRTVKFPLGTRLEMTSVMVLFYLLMLAIPMLLFWRSIFWPVILFILGVSFFYGIFLPWIPGRDGLYKGVTLSFLTILIVIGLYFFQDNWQMRSLWNRIFGYGVLAFFVGAEFQGMSPKMRGEQANWTIEALVGLIVLIVYFIPNFLGYW